MKVEEEEEGGEGEDTIVTNGIDGLHEITAHVVGAGGDPPHELLGAPRDAPVHRQRPLQIVIAHASSFPGRFLVLPFVPSRRR